MLFLSKKRFYVETKTPIKLKNSTKLLYISKGVEENKLKKCLLPPKKPERMPSVKYAYNDRLVNNSKQTEFSVLAENLAERDVNAPKLVLKSLIDLDGYECELISDRFKRLDRMAIIETNNLLLINSIGNQTKFASVCCGCEPNCFIISKNFSLYLAKYLTYNDLQLLQFNIDFGLGILNGLELLVLPHGELIRKDIIERCILTFTSLSCLNLFF